MEGRITCGLWLLTSLLGWGRLSAFNLDTANVKRMDGESGSLFGFSLAMHRQLSPRDTRMLLVGAPQAKALSGEEAKITGGLYKCDINSESCTRVIFDNDEDINSESKDNQWMGVTVSSQGPGGKVLTCAHRYQRRSNVNQPSETRDIIGRCYVLSQDLTIKASLVEDGGDWHFCDNRRKGHEMFGSCQQGLSATFDNDFHYFIFGAPGAYDWKGVVRLEQRNETFINMGLFEDGPFEVGDETEKNPRLVPAPSNSYMGFSLASGKRLTNNGELTVVAGAPRAYYSGAVILLKKGEQTSRVMLEEYTLKGEGLASSFGYDVAVLDLNADGWDDIVVGAPQYFEKDGEIGGAVYVFFNKGGNWDKVKPIRIDGPMDSMFGLTVENLGDINQDGYHDFAVGAPYKDSGVVYIYHGSVKAKFDKTAAQVLLGKSEGVKLFGYSLAGNMDLDGNSYPDLAVGSLSNSVFVYRSRPVVNIQKEISFTPSKIDLSKKNCGDTFCLEVKACFSDMSPKSNSPDLNVRYSLEVDADHRKNGLIPRAAFTTPSGSDQYKSDGTITMKKGQKECVTQKLAIQEKIKDKLHGIPIDVSVKIVNSQRKRRQSSTSPLSPVLDAKDQMATREMVGFLKEGCGSDDVCESNLQVKYRYGYMKADEDTFTPLKMDNGVPLITLSKQKVIALEVKVTNLNKDDAYEASVIANLPNSLTYAAYRLSDKELPVTCIANKNGSSAECELGNPFKRGSETTFYIILSTARISLSVTEVEVELLLNTTSTQKNLPFVKAKAKVALELQLNITGQVQPSQVYFSGEVRGESAMKTESDIGSAITHQFRIINRGKPLTDVGIATLNIDWPKETADGKWLLYLMKISSKGVENIKCSPNKEINLLHKEAVNSRKRRSAGNSQKGIDGTISRLLNKKNNKTLSCESGATCVRMRCPLGDLDSNAIVTLNSRLWNSTFIEDYSEFHHVEVIVKASLHINSTAKNTVLTNAETKVRLTVFPEKREAQYRGVPWWIIVLSILLILLLLGLLAFILWKCGVFGKKNKEDPSEKEKLTSNA
ncbi:integrin alpha-6 [Kryptolebias marmoratus]|uniref:Integrin subunit alpha 6 n=1 Tax=Kryptolebias marmoratus TaxID=37003 RepID=A0A3Q3A4U5_KRYMA|nr:integrin alpha-6 [Kryptolebias marmoratus]XP_017277782.1 integrin alpha-6 [Kryptolebias marmoratus]